MSTRAVVIGQGMSAPDQVVTNFDLEKTLDTSDEWIRQRTGIVERRIATKDEAASDFCIIAAKQALDRAGFDPANLDLVIVATVSGDMPFPSTAALVQDGIGATHAGAMDVGAACAGYIYGMSVAAAMIESGQMKNILVVGVDILSKFVDWTDRSTAVLFGDGAGATLLQAQENTDRGVLKTVLRSDGAGGPHITYARGGSRYPVVMEGDAPPAALYMNGNEVYRFAVKAMGDACCRVLNEAGMSTDDVDLFVPHQANQRIIDSARQRLGLAESKVFVNVDRYGNTSAGSIPLALAEAEQSGQLKQGMVVMTVGFGAGLVWGANLIRW